MQHSGFLVFAFVSWKHQCITSYLERIVEGSIELVAWGQKYIMLNLERSGKGSNKRKFICSAGVIESRGWGFFPHKLSSDIFESIFWLCKKIILLYRNSCE